MVETTKGAGKGIARRKVLAERYLAALQARGYEVEAPE